MQFKNQSPIYIQIADYILDNILNKEWLSGDRIKSVRELAAEVEVNPNTVMRTYSFLSDHKIIINKRGIGYFLSPDALEKAKAYRISRFLELELPPIFKTMDLLKINFEEIFTIHKNHQNEKK